MVRSHIDDDCECERVSGRRRPHTHAHHYTHELLYRKRHARTRHALTPGTHHAHTRTRTRHTHTRARTRHAHTTHTVSAGSRTLGNSGASATVMTDSCDPNRGVSATVLTDSCDPNILLVSSTVLTESCESKTLLVSVTVLTESCEP